MTPTQAAEGLSNLAKQYRSVLDAAKVLEEIGQLDAAIETRKKAATKAEAELDVLDERILAAKTELAMIESSRSETEQVAKRCVENARSEAAEIVRVAKIEVAQAKEDADALIKQAQAEADAWLKHTLAEQKDAEASRDTAKAEMERINNEIAEAVARISKK